MKLVNLLLILLLFVVQSFGQFNEPEMVSVPAGSFLRGTNNVSYSLDWTPKDTIEDTRYHCKPERSITLTHNYKIGKYELTQKE